MSWATCILFKILPLEITLLFTIFKALVILVGVWCITTSSRIKLEGLLPAAALQSELVAPSRIE